MYPCVDDICQHHIRRRTDSYGLFNGVLVVLHLEKSPFSVLALTNHPSLRKLG